MGGLRSQLKSFLVVPLILQSQQGLLSLRFAEETFGVESLQ